MFVPDDCIMSNTPVPMLAVEKPDTDESIDAQSTEKLLHSIANAQGMLCLLPLKLLHLILRNFGRKRKTDIQNKAGQ